MPQSPTADPRPFHMGDGPVGCLLLHGFTGSPAEVRPLGEHLADHGVRVVAPLLPGHGTEPQDMDHCTWVDWVAAAETVWGALEPQCSHLFVGGISMGALIAAVVAERHPQAAGLLAFSPALKASNRLLALTPLLRHVVRQIAAPSSSDLVDPEAAASLWHYETRSVAAAAQLYRLQRVVRRLLPRVMTPAIVFYARHDGAIARDSAWRYCQLLGSLPKTYAVYGRSGHNMLVDSERDMIMRQTWQWMQFCTSRGGRDVIDTSQEEPLVDGHTAIGRGADRPGSGATQRNHR